MEDVTTRLVFIATVVLGSVLADEVPQPRAPGVKGGRFVISQIDDTRKDQYLIDMLTGQIWAILETKEKRLILEPIEFGNLEKKDPAFPAKELSASEILAEVKQYQAFEQDRQKKVSPPIPQKQSVAETEVKKDTEPTKTPSEDPAPIVTQEVLPAQPPKQTVVDSVSASSGSLRIADLRISAAAGKLSSYDANYTYTAGSYSYFNSGYSTTSEAPGKLRAYRLGYTGGTIDEKGGALFGIGIQRLSVSEEFAGSTFDAIATGLQIKAAYGARLGEDSHLEIGPFVGVGLIKVDDADVTNGLQLDRETGDGTYVQLGMELGIYVALEKRLVLGFFASIDYASAKWNTDFSKTGGHVSADATWIALMGGVALGVRF